MNESPQTKVVVGLSGGVDSSVAAALLLDAGYSVVGVFIKAWQPDFLPCTWKENRQSAMQVAATLGIPFHTVDLSAEYKLHVFDEMVQAYARGETPNPDVACNEYVKFGFFMKYAESLGASYVATGHYAQIAQSAAGSKLRTAQDGEKDQTYFLAHIRPEILSKVLFPIGHLLKSEVRTIARKKKLPTHNRKDSQGLCFVGHLDMKDFLRKAVSHSAGAVLDSDGDKIGTHDGVELYTLGERHGFKSANKSDTQTPLYVIHKNVSLNTLTVATSRPISKVATIHLRDVRLFIATHALDESSLMRFRYRQELVPCEVKRSDDGFTVIMRNTSDVPSTGQLLVLYKNELVIASGIIAGVVETP